MADIELVIKIDEEEYNNIKGIRYYIPEKIRSGKQLTAICLNAIANGTPLPKGHGKIIDVQDVIGTLMWYKEFGNVDKPTIRGCIDRIKNHIKPIIEADRSEE